MSDFSVVSAESGEIFKACKIEERIVRSNGILNGILSEYIHGISSKCAVIEHSYIDRDFIEDYASYYSRCFSKYERVCQRVHFFSRAYTKKQLEKILLEQSKDDVQKLCDSYLGFVVLRPLQSTVVGRTCLVPYPQGETGRRYPAVCRVDVSFFGIPLFVSCMPFQEQDFNVAACMTCSLWSAFYVAASVFGGIRKTPNRITHEAVKHGRSTAREFPNHGVYHEDAVYAIREANLDPVVVDVTTTDPLMLANKFLGNVYAYLNLGVGVVVIVDIVDQTYGAKKSHAITINGYHIDKPYDVNKKPGNSLYACRIDKLYANDDQRVPYSRISVLNNGGKMKLLSCWEDRLNINKRLEFKPISIIVPVYCKIRVSYEEVWDVANEFDCMIQRCIRLNDDIKDAVLEWDITLRDNKSFKQIVRAHSEIPREVKLNVLKANLPKYIWLICAKINNVDSAYIGIDATDAGQGLRIVDSSVFITRDLAHFAEVLVKGSSGSATNILCNYCLGA